jgi:hypothetical protein
MSNHLRDMIRKLKLC